MVSPDVIHVKHTLKEGCFVGSPEEDDSDEGKVSTKHNASHKDFSQLPAVW